MQAEFLKDEQKVKSFRASLSEARIARYINEAEGDFSKAVQLYNWNALLSQSLYIPMQMWEVSLRNRLNSFLIWKYNDNWPYDARLTRNLKKNEQRRLTATIERQRQQRKIQNIPLDPIVADLSAGFWVGLLTSSYDVPFVWRYNLPRVFPKYAAGFRREDAGSICDGLLDIRNRIAHHEPIYHRDILNRWAGLQGILSAMCDGAAEYAISNCSFEKIYDARP